MFFKNTLAEEEGAQKGDSYYVFIWRAINLFVSGGKLIYANLMQRVFECELVVFCGAAARRRRAAAPW
jgi:hypothetical protein